MGTVRMADLLEQARSFDPSKAKPRTTTWAPLEEGFASDAQRRAAFASGYKEKGKKKKEEDVEVQEDGHTDVASAQTNVKVAMSALTKMSGELAKLSPEDALPSWWTNKVAVAVDKLDGMADYLDTQVEALDTEDEPKVKGCK